MNKEQVESWLRQVCAGKDWFHSVGWDQYGRAVVYVKYMDGEVLRLVPDFTEDGKQVLCHFAASATGSDFVNKPQEKKYSPFDAPHGEVITLTQEEAKRIGLQPLSMLELEGAARRADADASLSPEDEEKMVEMQVQALTSELDKLERLCGSNILADIFFETHDKGNAVTNLSVKFPEVRQRMEKLYGKYGFDIIYEELEL